MKHIYYKNDFAVEITLLNASGEVVAPPDWQWHIEFTDGRRKYICSVDNGNAKVVGNTIMCYLDNHKFCCGEVGYKFVQAIPDLNYLDGFQNLITPKALPIELWEQESDNDVNIQSSVVPAYVVYDAYMTAKANGYTGTAEEYYNALNHIVDINKKESERVEAEANRVTAEQQRVENFAAMESALTTATTKANTATTNATQATKQATTATKRANDISADLEAKREADYWRGAKGEKGDKGDRGEKGDQGERGLQGVQGVKGDDGVSPTVKTSKAGKVTTIEITDAQGTHTATVNDGESVEVVQSTGNSTTSVMSQKAVSDALSTKVGKTELDSYATKEYVQTNAPRETKESIEEKLGAWLEEDGGDADGEVYTKAESDARYLRGEVLYEDYYYPNMGETTDKVNFTDSTQILQPTKFIESYTDADGATWSNVFECESFPDWFDFAERECYPYGNGISTAVPFFKNYTIDNGELIYNFDSMQNINIEKKLPYFTINVGLKKIDDNHFNLYTAKTGTVEFTSFDKENVDCSLFAFGPVVNVHTYDIDDCKMFRLSLIGNFKQPSKYSTIISSGSDISIKGYIQRQQLYGNEYVDFEIDKLNKRYRQIGAGYSMWHRTSHTQNWNKATQESFYSQCTLGWRNIPNGLALEVCNVGGKLIYSLNAKSNQNNILIMGCKIKIEKLA